ncbi:MAG: PEP-CTERM sorting domain-containing protein [Planctomycetota bacterium]|nr:PEP-CTERM sorting domain-containing protein [Planctomycetota bacterium]
MRIVRSAGLCFVAALWLGAGVAHADITYGGSWDASATPQDSTPPFEFRGDAGYATLVTTGADAPYLNINTPATFGNRPGGHFNDYTLNNDPAIDLSAGGTIDFTMRVNGQSDPADSSNGVNAFVIYAPNGSEEVYIYALWAEVGKMAGHDMDTSQWHDYRVVLGSPGDNATLFVDGSSVALISGGSPVGLPWNGFRFGDVSDSRSGDVDWKFIGWNPVPEPSILALLSAMGLFFLLERRKQA